MADFRTELFDSLEEIKNKAAQNIELDDRDLSILLLSGLLEEEGES